MARMLHPSSTLAAPALAAIACRLASVSLPWQHRDGGAPAERCYELLLATRDLEVWTIYWPPGGSLELHDHGGSSGALCVVAGHLDEACLVGRTLRTRRLGRGGSVAFGPGHVHDVVNATARPATSMHVYSPPLSSMTFYDRQADGTVVPARTDHFQPADRRVTGDEGIGSVVPVT